MQNFDAQGNSIKITTGAVYTSGLGVEIGDRAGVAAHAAASGVELEVLLEGIVTLAKTNVAVAVGEKLYWDDADGNVQKDGDSGTNKAIGWATEAAASGVATIGVKLGAF